MARFRYDEAEKYGGQGGSGFFYLREDGEIAKVRFMYDNIDDVEGMSVHQIEIDGKNRYVNCLREYNQSVDVCPFCREHMFTSAKLFIPIYDEDEQKVKIWERGKKFFSKISSLCARYPHLVSHVCEIERHGAKGDTQTSYEIYPGEDDGTTLNDLPERPEILGGLVLDKTADEMEFYLQNGYFKDNAQPVRRRDTVDRTERSVPTRRTPRNREDAF